MANFCDDLSRFQDAEKNKNLGEKVDEFGPSPLTDAKIANILMKEPYIKQLYGWA